MTTALEPGVAEEIATKHGFHQARLRDALIRAVQAHHDEQGFRGWREQVTAQVADTTPVLAAVRRAIARWEKLSPEAQHEVANFVDPSDTADPVGSKLRFVAELLEEYGEHYRRPRGNPGRSRTGGNANDIAPLRAFSSVLMDFWRKEKGTPFGHVIERQFDLGGVNPMDDTTAPPDARSPAMEFLHHAGMVLHPTNYSIENFETVVRDIKGNPGRI